MLRGRQPTLRLYSWSPAGLSLGFFQEHSAFASVPGSHIIVRRATGGGAIFHDEEITFSLSLDLTSDDPGIVAWYLGVHAAVQTALQQVQIPVEFSHGSSVPDPAGQRRSWCFASPGPHDLVSVSGGKIMGSAQRRIRRPSPRLLHHASLMLRAPASTPDCGSVAEYQDPAGIREDLEDCIIQRISDFLGLRPEAASPEESELELAGELASGLHSSSAHLLRR